MDDQRSDGFSMAELVDRTGVPASTVHHYVRRGLLPAPTHLGPKRFLYGPDHVDALRVIRTLRHRQRLSLSRIAEVLPEILAGNGLELLQEPPAEGDPQGSVVAERILDVAIEAFGLHSYGEVSIADLCAGADVAKGTFYRHFDSKSQVFVRAAERAVLQMVERFRSEIAELPGPVEVHDAARLFASALRPGLPLLLELAKRSMLFEPEYVRAAREAFRLLANEIGEILQPGEPDSRAAAGMVILDATLQVFRSLVDGHDPGAGESR